MMCGFFAAPATLLTWTGLEPARDAEGLEKPKAFASVLRIVAEAGRIVPIRYRPCRRVVTRSRRDP